MIFRKEEINQFQAADIVKIDGYISRFENDLREDYILLNVPDVWFRILPEAVPLVKRIFDLVFLPKDAIESISPSVETTILKRFLRNERLQSRVTRCTDTDPVKPYTGRSGQVVRRSDARQRAQACTPKRAPFSPLCKY